MPLPVPLHLGSLRPSLPSPFGREKRYRFHSVAVIRSQSDDEDGVYQSDTPPKLFTVIKEASNFDVETLVNKYKRGDLNLRPVYQRGFVWDRKMASKLVLTVLKGLPIPQVILHGKEVKDESGEIVAKLDVIDGKQRLTSLLAFVMSDNMGWKEAPVTLDLLVKNSGDGGPGQYAWYHGKKFTDLKRMQQKTVLDSLISILTIGKETETKAVFEMYKSLNSGGVKCSDQQLRRSAFFGKYLLLLDTLAKNENFVSVIRGASKPSSGSAKNRHSKGHVPPPLVAHDEVVGKQDGDTEEDRELILRFFAMSRSGEKFKSPMVEFLNEEISNLLDPDPKTCENMTRQFNDGIGLAYSIWGNSAFRKFDPISRKYETAFNKPLWDTVMVVLSEAADGPGAKKKVMDRLSAVKSGFEDLFINDEEWKVSLARTTAKNLKNRRRKLEQVIDEAVPTRQRLQQRAFSEKDRQEMFDADPTCALCGNAIVAIEDAQVDHIKPFSKGGLTERSNAQLAHAFCNQSKGNREGGGA